MSVAARHAEWLSLVPTSGSFLSVGVLTEAFPNGLDGVDPHVVGDLRTAYEMWSDTVAGDGSEAERHDIHRAWVRYVLQTLLDLDDELLSFDPEVCGTYRVELPAHDAELVPGAVLEFDGETRMLVQWTDPSVEVERPVPGDAWTATPAERMAVLLRETGCPLGLVTDGERWTLVSVREGEVPGYATWWASIWLEERVTLRAFRSLLHARRFASVPDEEMLAELLARSAADQSEITTKLGTQTLHAVEILIRTLDRLDRDRGGKLLLTIDEGDLYDAAVTVMMRLIFLFYAEENELLPVGQDLYADEYAATTLRARLQKEADLHGEEILETRQDAWPRLLATWRAVFGGAEHLEMRIAPYGGSLFDPDRYPFLEGRAADTSWHDTPASPLPVDNRTVLHLLTALQTIEERGHRRLLSFRALDVEQIGHVYEGMLDHTARRAKGWVLGLTGVSGAEPEVPLEDLEAVEGDDLVDLLKARTNRGKGTTKRWVEEDPAASVESFGLYWVPAFQGDEDAEQRIRRYAKFIRPDSQGAPTVFAPGSVYVSDSAHRGATGTHYTPRAMTEEIVRETLEPLVYAGPAEGLPESEWKLRPPNELLELNVADPACGSGAFLVQTVRHLADLLVESRRLHGELDRDPTEEDLVDARREVAARGVYGVDKNPMAVEMAKMSLWLVTLAHDRPFSFVDHALGTGDSLFGLHDLEQLRRWDLSGEGESQSLFTGAIGEQVDKAVELRRQVEAMPVVDHSDAQIKRMLLDEADEALAVVRGLADLLFAPSLSSTKQGDIDTLRQSLLSEVTHYLEDAEWMRDRARRVEGFIEPLHWAIEFPEVFERGGFDALVGNPPFLGGSKITGALGTAYREYLVRSIADGSRGGADLVAYFVRRAVTLVRQDGLVGLITVNTIAEGRSRDVGLEPLADGGAAIVSARTNEVWPNSAAVITSRVIISNGAWDGSVALNGHEVESISPFLTPGSEVAPKQLLANAGTTFEGSKVYGSGFLLPVSDAEKLLHVDARNRDVLYPYVGGRDLNQDPAQEASRWAVCFWDWPRRVAETYAQPFAHVAERVKPYRRELDEDGSFKRRDPLPQLWWIYAEKRPALYHAVGRGQAFKEHPVAWDGNEQPLTRTIVSARVGKYWGPSLVPNNAIFSDACTVFASDSPALLALLVSCAHREWTWKQASSLETRLRYTPSDCFETFPLPVHGELPDDVALHELGSEYHELRKSIMLDEQIGLTDLYNRFHEASDADSRLKRLRDLHVAIDRRTLELYNWDDIELDHGFRSVTYLPSNDDVRFTISEDARLELLDRLGKLNLERYEQEVRDGLHGKKALAELRKKERAAAEASA